ncbi:MAG: DUF2975 domain-containing protein [Candidatus Neomarinimicrobiota bacterium]|nr:DUF2975 domain-containing protein [Candidatus Neomarinimicrobiota bacterium]
MPGKSQLAFIKIVDWLLTGFTALVAGYILYRFIMLLVGPVLGITDQTTKLYYPVQFHVDEEGMALMSDQELSVKLKHAKAIAIIEAPTPTGLLVPVKLIRYGMFGFIIWVMFLMRQIVRSVGKGQPFIPENGERLRWIGLSILLIIGFDFFHDILLNLFITPRLTFDSIVFETSNHFDFRFILLALVILVIGEAFRIGAEMKKEQDLMI